MEMVIPKDKKINNWSNYFIFRQNKFFNSITLKMIALISMIIDHVGLMIFPQIIILRILGRIALPIYTFLIAFGFEKTKNSASYFLKFFLIFICLQIPTTWFLYLQENPHISPFYMNIFANLTLGAGFIIIYQKNKIISAIYFGLILTSLIFIQKYNLSIITPLANEQRFIIDYGIFGFLLIPTFWMTRKLINFVVKESKFKLMLINITSIILFTIILLLHYFFLWKIDSTLSTRSTIDSIQLYGLFAIPFLLLFTEYQFNIQSAYTLKAIKYFFWLSYPLTIGIIALITATL